MSHDMHPICCAECQAEIELRCPNGHDVLRQMPTIRKAHRDPIAHLRAPKGDETPSRWSRHTSKLPRPPKLPAQPKAVKPVPCCNVCGQAFPKRTSPGRYPKRHVDCVPTQIPVERAPTPAPTMPDGPQCSTRHAKLEKRTGRPRRYCDTCEPPAYRKQRLWKDAWNMKHRPRVAASAPSSDIPSGGKHGKASASSRGGVR